jgi:hypothetical protein
MLKFSSQLAEICISCNSCDTMWTSCGLHVDFVDSMGEGKVHLWVDLCCCCCCCCVVHCKANFIILRCLHFLGSGTRLPSHQQFSCIESELNFKLWPCERHHVQSRKLPESWTAAYSKNKGTHKSEDLASICAVSLIACGKNRLNRMHCLKKFESLAICTILLYRVS